MTAYSNTSGDTSGWGSNQEGQPWRGGRCRPGHSWKPLEIAAMVLGFMVFWPIGLAVIAFKIWQKRTGYGGDLTTFAQEKAEWARNACSGWQGVERDIRNGMRRGWSPGGPNRGGMRPTGNSAFDEWRAAELSRLEEERRKLEDAEREFAEHIDQLRRARDREEFERFMNARRGRGAGDMPTAQP